MDAYVRVVASRDTRIVLGGGPDGKSAPLTFGLMAAPIARGEPMVWPRQAINKVRQQVGAGDSSTADASGQTVISAFSLTVPTAQKTSDHAVERSCESSRRRSADLQIHAGSLASGLPRETKK